MAYTAGIPQPGVAFAAAAARSDKYRTQQQNADDELLRKFVNAINSKPDSPFQGATVPRPGAYLNPNHALVGIDDQGMLGIDDPGGGMAPGGEIPVGEEMTLAPQMRGGAGDYLGLFGNGKAGKLATLLKNA